jgi:hypothetical protein
VRSLWSTTICPRRGVRRKRWPGRVRGPAPAPLKPLSTLSCARSGPAGAPGESPRSRKDRERARPAAHGGTRAATWGYDGFPELTGRRSRPMTRA